MVQTQMCINDNFDDSNRTPIMKRRREVPKHGASHFFDQSDEDFKQAVSLGICKVNIFIYDLFYSIRNRFEICILSLLYYPIIEATDCEVIAE